MNYTFMTLIMYTLPIFNFGLTAYMVMNDHPGWAVAFFIAGILLCPDIKWKYKDDGKKEKML